MSSALRARGILGTALTFAVGLAGLASTLLIAGVEAGVVPSAVYGIRELVAVAARGAIVGALLGAGFSILVSWRERGRRIERLRYPVFASTGFLVASGLGLMSGIVAPGLLPAGVLVTGAVGLGALGAGFGVLTLALARHAVGLPALPRRTPHESTALPPVI